MRRHPESFATAVRAFKEMTAATDDAAATRARVLAAADRGTRSPGTPRRIAVMTAIALLVICSASVAGTTLAQRWRRPAVVAIEEMPPSVAAFGASDHTGSRPSVVIPPVVPALDEASAPGPSDAEADAYGRAHRAHFDEGAPEQALAAWDDYLRRYPRGAFEPEARFNRAICLVRLRRFAQAERALRSFSDGRFANYRRAEAEQLLAWLRDRSRAP
jgi:tetratricopeptide (TPR) repeat protein